MAAESDAFCPLVWKMPDFKFKQFFLNNSIFLESQMRNRAVVSLGTYTAGIRSLSIQKHHRMFLLEGNLLYDVLDKFQLDSKSQTKTYAAFFPAWLLYLLTTPIQQKL